MNSLASRLEFLRSSQNPDGGWSYLPGKRQSWLEPSAYALLALHGDASSVEQSNKAWKLLLSWQNPSGSWKPAGEVEGESWATALMVTLCCVRGEYGEVFHKGVNWLVGTEGSDSEWFPRAVQFLHLNVFNSRLGFERDVRFKGWPWRPNNASWVEPSAHALIAIKKAAPHARSAELKERIRMGDLMILDRKCSDGGWNSGAPRSLHIDLVSYPETTALALLGLQGQPRQNVAAPLAVAMKFAAETHLPLAQAWLAICLRNWGVDFQSADSVGEATGDVLITALQALGDPQGNHHLLKVGETA